MNRKALVVTVAAIIATVAVVPLGVDAQPSAALIEARRHMLDPEINAVTFRSMAALFDTLRVENEGQPSTLKKAPAALDFAYEFDGERRPAETFLERTYTNALLIVKNDRLVHERYLNNTDESTHFISMSVAKSITSTLIGMAIDDGSIASVDDPLTKYVPELATSGYAGVTIRQALLMRSGTDWNERYDFGKESPMQRLHDAAVVENRIRFVEPAFALGRAHAPGEVFNYSTVETAVLGLVLERATGRPLAEFMSERWWKPAGMQSYGFWIADGPRGVGKAINGMGFNAVARDYARFGLMMLHGGRANGRQLVSSEWVAEATTATAATEPLAPGATRGYQYQWWTLTGSPAFFALGLQGQYVYVDPATQTVVVKLSYFPPGAQAPDAETEAFLRAVSQWQPRPDAAGSAAALGPTLDVRSQHPLDALSADEIRKTREILRAAGRTDDTTRFPTLTLQEPDKSSVRTWRDGTPVERRAFATAMQGGRVYEAVVDLEAGTVERWEEVEGVEPRVLLEESDVNGLLWANDDWRAAMAKRGYDATSKIFCAPLSPGPALPRELAERRILYSACYDVSDAMPMGRPIEGLMGVVDVGRREVVSVVDLGVVPVPPGPAGLGYEHAQRHRTPTAPIEVATPRGSNVRLDGSHVRWDNWDFHLRVDQRVGPVLSLVKYDDHGTQRDVAYQIAVSEMFVPYMDPAPTWSWKAYMDVGEYGFGLLASRLRPGTDCPASAHFIDQTIANDLGEPFVLGHAVCIFERPNGGPLWRHAGGAGHEGVPDVDLVVRMAPVVGNYDYIVDYVLTRTGEIEVRAGATGIDAVKAVAARSMLEGSAKAETANGTMIASGLVGINHDHYISFRVDLDVDGARNRAVFDAVTAKTLPRGEARRSLWTVTPHVIDRAGPLAHAAHDGYLRLESTERTNAVGNPTSFQLYVGHTATSVLTADDPLQARAEWSRHPIWLSRYAPNELYASGPYPNQNRETDGLMKWTREQQPIDGEDVVLWYTMGFRHVTRAEDWPAMPTVWHSLRLRPFNFFDENPAMDVPR